jgi:hypothetical protein
LDLNLITALAGVLALLIMKEGIDRLLPGRTARKRRALAALPSARIGEAHGTVRVSGRIRPGEQLLKAPLSGRRCVGYELVIYTWGGVTSGGAEYGTAEWRWLVDAQKACPFFVADEGGEARIDTSGPFSLALVHDRTGTTKGRYPGEHRALARFLKSKGIDATTWLGGWRAFKYGEGVLVEGELVTVGGDSAEEIDPRGERTGLRSPPEKLVLRGTEKRPLLIATP